MVGWGIPFSVGADEKWGQRGHLDGKRARIRRGMESVKRAGMLKNDDNIEGWGGRPFEQSP